MIATYRGNTYETEQQKGQEAQPPALTYRGVPYQPQARNHRPYQPQSER
ncbi:MAG: hypothetical protein CL844_04940 [Crocinitomicaceae bacterium]|nr:hypothetical protein [Crocinitomicaceae bacterium]